MLYHDEEDNFIKKADRRMGGRGCLISCLANIFTIYPHFEYICSLAWLGIVLSRKWIESQLVLQILQGYKTSPLFV